MPDIESEIRLKSSGADQVARDLKQIKEAAEDTSQSLEGVESDYGSGKQDPFKRASSGGTPSSPQTARQVMERQERNARELDRAKDRESENRGRSLLAAGNQRAQQAVTGVGQGVNQISQGGPAGLMGGLGGMMSKLLSGPGGWLALGASVLGGIGGQQAEKAFQFHRGGYLQGTTQRLGISGSQRRGIYGEMIETGIAPEMVGQYMTALSQSGGTLEQGKKVSTGIDYAMDLGADASRIGQLAGLTQRLGLGGPGGNAIANREMMQRMVPAFGQQNVNTFLGGMQTFLQGQEQMYTPSGTTTAGMVNEQAAFMGNLRNQGLTASAATQLANKVAQRGRQSSQLSDPTDMLVLSQMRQGDESILDTMARMESDPGAAREAFMESISGMNQEAQTLAIRRRYGVGVQGARAIARGDEQAFEEFAREEQDVRQEERATEAVFSNQFFAGLQDTLLKVIRRVGEVTGMFSEGEAAQITLTGKGAKGPDEAAREEAAAQAAERYRNEIEDMNVRANSVEVVTQESGRGDLTNYLENFGMDFANTAPRHFDSRTAMNIAGLNTGTLGKGGNAILAAAQEAGLTSDEAKSLRFGEFREARGAVAGRIRSISSEYGEGEGREQMVATFGAIKEYLNKLIDVVVKQTDVEREALRQALGLETVNTDGKDSDGDTNWGTPGGGRPY